MSDLPPPTLPPTQPYASPNPYDQDTSHLNTLSIFYFILAGLQALGTCLGLGYVVLGVMLGLVGVAGSGHDNGGAAAGVGLGGMFACLGIFVMLVIGTFAYLNFLTGKSLRQRKRKTLCQVMAAIACLNVPLGTVLGVFTFVVLSRPSVKASFEGTGPGIVSAG